MKPQYRQPNWRPDLAPNDLWLPHALLLSHNAALDIDELADVDAMNAWLRKHQLDAGSINEEARIDARSLRQALEVLVQEGGPVDDNAAMEPLHVDVEETLWIQDGQVLRQRHFGDGWSSIRDRIVAATLEALQEPGLWSRLKICRNPKCRWVFFDANRSRQQVWCHTLRCGNNVHKATYKRRHPNRPYG